MYVLTDEITSFLEGHGFTLTRQTGSRFDTIAVRMSDGIHDRVILPLEITSGSAEEAAEASERALACIESIRDSEGEYPLIITQDRWHRQRKMMQKRLLAHLEVFSQAYARNCELRKIDKATARGFLMENHSYGHAACRHCYGLFLKRYTGHAAGTLAPGTLVAVATFSNARKWLKGGKTISSYEWTRYASLPDLRLSGGMGKMLKGFIRDVRPDDIMTYADLEWSAGDVYRTLGFEPEGAKDAVMFTVTEDWVRIPARKAEGASGQELSNPRYFRNFGSSKFRLKLTPW